MESSQAMTTIIQRRGGEDGGGNEGKRHRCGCFCGAHTVLWAVNTGLICLALLALVSIPRSYKGEMADGFGGQLILGIGLLVLTLIGLKLRQRAWFWPQLIAQVLALVAILVLIGVAFVQTGSTAIELNNSLNDAEPALAELRTMIQKERGPTSYYDGETFRSYYGEEARQKWKASTGGGKNVTISREEAEEKLKQLERVEKAFSDLKYKSRDGIRAFTRMVIAEHVLLTGFVLTALYLWLTIRAYRFVREEAAASKKMASSSSSGVEAGRLVYFHPQQPSQHVILSLDEKKQEMESDEKVEEEEGSDANSANNQPPAYTAMGTVAV